MFLKPFIVKSQTLIKGSDRKKIRNDIGKRFSTFSEDDLTLLVPNKGEMSVMKLVTHSEDIVIVYCLSKNPYFFEIEEVIYPTVYALWNCPELMFSLATWPPVLSKLQSGADLMLPGVILTETPSPKMLGDRPKYTPYSIKLFPNQIPVAVGKSALSSNDMFMAAMRGKAVLVLHTYGDNLWALGDKSQPPFLEDTELVHFMKEKQGGTETSPDEATSLVTDPQPPDIQNLNINESDSDDDDNLDAKSMSEIQDELLRQCLLCALKDSVKRKDLPLLTSNLFRNHMLPYCPAGKKLDVKKSSWKKLSKFLQNMQKEGLLNVKELSKGSDSVIKINRDHPDLKSTVVPERTAIQENENNESSEPIYQPPEISQVYLVTAACLPVFRPAGYEKGSALSVPDVRQVIVNYVKDNNLQDAARKRLVTLDPVLCDLVTSRDDRVDRIAWEDMIPKVLDKMTSGYRVTVAGGAPVIRKGKIDPISMNVLQRGGKKKVTLIHNLETFLIDPTEFAHLVQIGVACSTTVNLMPGKNQCKEVLVQGNQVAFVTNLLLDKFKVPRKFLLGTEKAPKGKRR